MGSTSDLAVMRKAADFLESMEVPFELKALSAHRTPAAVESFAREARDRGIEVIIAGAGMAAALPGVIAALTTVPVIGVPINATLDGVDALYSIIQMPRASPLPPLASTELSTPACSPFASSLLPTRNLRPATTPIAQPSRRK